MEPKELIKLAMTEMGKRSAAKQKANYGSDYSKEMQRRSKRRLELKVERQKQTEYVKPN